MRLFLPALRYADIHELTGTLQLFMNFMRLMTGLEPQEPKVEDNLE